MAAALAATATGDYRDLETVRAFARGVDVLTFDHEHVPQEVLRALIADGVAVHPGPDALQFAQDKLLMRRRLTDLGIPCPAWAAVHDAAELEAFAPEVLAAARAALEAAVTDLDFVRLDAGAFGQAPKTSIDYAVMERAGLDRLLDAFPDEEESIQ